MPYSNDQLAVARSAPTLRRIATVPHVLSCKRTLYIVTSWPLVCNYCNGQVRNILFGAILTTDPPGQNPSPPGVPLAPPVLSPSKACGKNILTQRSNVVRCASRK